MSEQKFKTGDVVKLKSGGPDMTVSGYVIPIDIKALADRTEPQDPESEIVICRWFDDTKPLTTRYHQDLLELLRADN